MMQDADRKRVVKLLRERQVKNVSLNDVNIRQRTRGSKRRFHSYAEIDTDNLARTPARGQLRMPPLAATAFEHHFVAKKLRLHGRDPADQLFRVAFVFVREVLPLPAK